MANFKCKKGHEFEVFHFIKVYGKLKDEIKDKNRNPLKCPECGSEDIEQIYSDESKGFPTFAKIGSMSPEDRRKVLMKRSKEHSKKPSEVERRKNMSKNFTGKTNEKYY